MQGKATTIISSAFLRLISITTVLWWGQLMAAEETEEAGEEADSATVVKTTEGKNATQDAKTKEAWEKFFPPPDDKFDWLQLTSAARSLNRGL